MHGLPARISHELPLNLSRFPVICQIQVAGLRATFGEPYPYAKPYPYETKKLTLINEWFDNSTARMNENSKVIIVEGNVGVGKNAFAERLAKNFDFKVFNSVPDDVCFKMHDNNFDIRTLDECLPERCRTYDLKKFLLDPHPEKGTVGRLQLDWFKHRFMVYARGLLHVLSTGQGVVIVRSAFGDEVMVEAFTKLGYVTRNFFNYYQDYRANSICELLKPHITIYLDAPINVLMDRIRQRNNPTEMKSKIINEEYLQAIKWAFEHRFLDKMRTSGEVLEIDWSEVADDTDMEVIAEEMQHLTLERENNEDLRFKDWATLTEDMLCYYRRAYNAQQQLENLFCRPMPWDCPEVMYNSDDFDILNTVYNEHPAIAYRAGWAPELGHKSRFRM